MMLIVNVLVALAIASVVWDGFQSGRALYQGPDRRHAPISYWLAQFILLAAMALNLGLAALRLWT